MPIIKDWVVQAQWDDSKIEKGLKRLEKSFQKVNLGAAKASRRQDNKLRVEKGITQQNRIQTQQFAMQERIKKSIYQTDQRIASLRGVKGGAGTTAALQGQKASLVSMGERLAGTSMTLKGLRDLKSEYNAVGMRAGSLNKKVTQLTRTMTTQQFAARSLKDSIRNLSRSYLSMFAVMAGAIGTFRVGEQLDQIKASLLGVSGNAVQVEKDWRFIRASAQGLGVDLTVAAKGYQQIGVAASTMGFSTKQANEIFLAAAESSKAFGLSTEDQMGVQRAFVQIMSKGVVSMEELKSQLGDRMPVAMALAAKSMGFPNEKMGEFIKLVSEGKVQSRDFILNFSKTLRENVRETGALDAALKTVATSRQRFVTSFKVGVGKGFADASGGLTGFFNTLTRVMNENVNAFKVLGSMVGTFFSGVTTAINIISPFIAIFTALLERIRVLFADALDLNKTVSELGHFARALRFVTSTIKLAIGGVLLLLSYLMDLSDFLGDNKTGLSTVLDGLAILFGVTLAGGIWLATKRLLGFSGAAKKLAGIGGGKGKGNLLSEGFEGKTKKGGVSGSKMKGLLKFAGPVGMALLAGDIARGVAPDFSEKFSTDNLFTAAKLVGGATSIIIQNPQFNVQNPVGGDIEGVMENASQMFGEYLINVGGT